jgi:hypothetical protein
MVETAVTVGTAVTPGRKNSAARAGIPGAPIGSSEIIPGRFTTAAPEIIAENFKCETRRRRKIKSEAEAAKSSEIASRNRFSLAKSIGETRPPAPDFEWAQPAPRLQWDEWDPFAPEPAPERKPAQPAEFSLETKPFYFPTGKVVKKKDGTTAPELKPSGEIATAKCGGRIFSVVKRSRRITSRFSGQKTSVPLSAAIKSIARIAGEENAIAARAAFLAVAPGLE